MNQSISRPKAIALNERGAKTAVRLGLQVMIGKPSMIIRDYWNAEHALVLVMALPIAIRTIATMNLSKSEDPVVVAVDESGKFFIPVLGGHRGANRLASELATRVNGTAVVTTSSELAEVPAVDGLSGFAAQGDIAQLIETMLEGHDPVVENRIGWPEPIRLKPGTGPARVIISDSALEKTASDPPTVQLIPPSLVAGVGCSSDASPEDVSKLLNAVCESSGLDRRAIAKIATIDIRAQHPAIIGQGLKVVSFSSTELSKITVPNPSKAVESAVGTPSVAEAAALLASRSDTLLTTKQSSTCATVALARQAPRGHLRIVGLGPGKSSLRTPAAVEAVLDSEIVIGFDAYVEQCRELLSPRQLILGSPIGKEIERAAVALDFAFHGRSVAVVCSGDPEVFAMASVIFETLEETCRARDLSSPADHLDISVIPGITAGLAGGAILGAPLGHDHAYLSLSDLLTPWETIESRIHSLGQADMVLILYNPASSKRKWQLPKAIEILKNYRPTTTPVAIVRNVGRIGEARTIFTLDTFDPTTVDMASVVIIGSSTTRQSGDYMFTPRGYKVSR